MRLYLFLLDTDATRLESCYPMCVEYFWVTAFTALTFVAWASSRQVTLVNEPGTDGWHWETKRTPGKDISGVSYH